MKRLTIKELRAMSREEKLIHIKDKFIAYCNENKKRPSGDVMANWMEESLNDK